jgi:hypothetical protein
MKRTQLSTILASCTVMTSVVAIPTARAADTDDAAVRRSFLRVDESKDHTRIALEIAERTYTPKNGEGPMVGLVAVAHIADQSFYDELETALGKYDLVLYESVTPTGTGGAGGDTDKERIASTHAAMRYLAALIEAYNGVHDDYPAKIEIVSAWSATFDPRMAGWAVVASVDAWSNAIEYRRLNAETGGGFALISNGADGAAGGDGADADLIVTHADDVTPMPLGETSDNIQVELARAINLSFQLEAMDYSHANWRCSDMSIDEVDRALTARGLDFNLIGDTLAGSSLPAKFIKLVLRMIRTFDSFTDGAITDTFKVVLIEMLGDETLIDASMGQLGEGFAEVIINERNQVVIDDVAELIANEPEIKSVAIFYGAGHMQDMEKRLIEQLSYEPAEATWFRAIDVNLNESAVSPREIRQLRVMMRRALHQATQATQESKAKD